MTLRIAINGFGRIGRVLFRQAMSRDDLEVVAVNDLAWGDNLAYLLDFDSIHGRMPARIDVTPDGFLVDGRKTKTFSERDAQRLPWKYNHIDYVIDCSGATIDVDGATRHLLAGARRVLLATHPADPANIPTLAFGINEAQFDPVKHRIVGSPSGLATAVAPLVRVLIDRFGLDEAMVTTVRALTTTQSIHDRPLLRSFRAGRSGCANLVLDPHDPVEGMESCIPETRGKLKGLAFSAPTVDVSVLDLVVRTTTPSSWCELCAEMARAADDPLRRVLRYTEEPLVSSDFKEDPSSCIFDATAGMALNERFFKLVAWYDSEWSFAARCLDLLSHMAAAEGLLP